MKTDGYKQLASRAKKVAVRAPEYCSGQSPSANDRQTEKTKTFIRSDCGVEIGTLERELANAGYAVFSWKVLDSEAKLQGRSYLEAARELGAEVLFSVNALVGVMAADEGLIKRSYYASSRDGEQGEPLELQEIHRRIIGQMIAPYENATFRATSFGASMDITAIDTDTGQAVWFF